MSTDSSSSYHEELSNLSNQLQTYRNLLLNSPYIEHIQSSNSSVHNSQYFPYYALVEKYLSFANEFNVKLKKSLVIQAPTESKTNHEQQLQEQTERVHVPSTSDSDQQMHCFTSPSALTDPNELSDSQLHPLTRPPSPSSPSSISLDSYLPIIEEDKETEYAYHYPNTHQEYNHEFVFTEPIYCKTLLHLSNTFGNDYNEVMALLVQIGGFHHKDIDCILFEGDEYGLVVVKQSMDYIRCAMENIERYTIQKNINVQINVIEERREVMNTRQSDTVYITNFDVLNANVDCDLMKVFEEYGSINHIQIVKDHSQECMRVYALLQFAQMDDAVQCYTVHNASSIPLRFASRLLHIEYANEL